MVDAKTAKTVDNLGPEVHRRYIHDLKLLEEDEIKRVFKTPNISRRAEILTTTAKQPEIDLLWGIKEKDTSPFTPPDDFVLSKDVFTYNLIPSFGDPEKILEKLNSLKKKKEEERKKKKGRKSKKLSTEDHEAESQEDSLINFTLLISFLNKVIVEIQKRKIEFTKG